MVHTGVSASHHWPADSLDNTRHDLEMLPSKHKPTKVQKAGRTEVGLPVMSWSSEPEVFHLCQFAESIYVQLDMHLRVVPQVHSSHRSVHIQSCMMQVEQK